MLRINIIDNEEKLLQIAEEWSTLLTKSVNNNVFLTPEWVLTWWKYFKVNKNLLVLIARDEDNKLVGVAPLVLSKRRGLPLMSRKIITFIGHPHSDYNDFILYEGKEEEILEAFFKYLEKYTSWDIIHLRDIPEDSPTLKYAPYLKSLKGYKYNSEVRTKCPYAILPSKWEEYLDGIQTGHMNQKKYYLRKFKKARKDFIVRFNFVNDEKHLTNMMNKLFFLHQRTWKIRGDSGIFSNPNCIKFYTEVAQKFYKKNWLRLYYLSFDKNVVAMLYGFKYGQKLYYYQTGLEPAVAKYSAGVILMGCCIESAISEGLNEFNFARGAESYKYNWASGENKNFRLLIFSRVPINYLYCWTIILSEKFSHIVPRPVRRMLKMLRPDF